MPGLRLRSLQVNIFWALQKPATKWTENYSATLVPASSPFACGNWRPGHGVPDPIPAISPDQVTYLPMHLFNNYEVDPIPARSL